MCRPNHLFKGTIANTMASLFRKNKKRSHKYKLQVFTIHTILFNKQLIPPTSILIAYWQFTDS